VINETTRIIRRWLDHPDYGVIANLHAPGFPHLNTAGEEDELPVDPTIYDDVDNATEVAKLQPPSSPALIVYADSDSRTDADTMTYQVTETPMAVAIAYVTKDVPEEVAVLGGGYTFRAVRRTLRQFNSQSLSQGYRELNGVKVMKVGLVTEQAVAASVGQSRLWGFVLASVTVVDRMMAEPST
jgi:hypothetical protein